MKKNLNLLVALLIIAVWQNGFSAGNTGLAFLRMGADARSSAMGEAAVAVSDNASAVFWNPANSAWISQRQAHLTHNEWIQGINNELASIILPFSKGVIGLNAILTSVDGFERRVYATEEPLEEFSAHDFSLGLSFAKMVGEQLSFGVTAKFINEKIYINNASGYALDFGMRYYLKNPGVYVGAALQNLGSVSELSEEKITLPKILRLGLAYKLPFRSAGGSWMLATDYIKLLDDDSHINVGTELAIFPTLTLRLGYQTGYEDRKISTGFGINVGPFIFDYAYVPFDSDLGNTQRFSLLVDF